MKAAFIDNDQIGISQNRVDNLYRTIDAAEVRFGDDKVTVYQTGLELTRMTELFQRLSIGLKQFTREDSPWKCERGQEALDVALARDAAITALEADGCGTLAIASGDFDYLPLLRYIQEKGTTPCLVYWGRPRTPWKAPTDLTDRKTGKPLKFDQYGEHMRNGKPSISEALDNATKEWVVKKGLSPRLGLNSRAVRRAVELLARKKDLVHTDADTGRVDHIEPNTTDEEIKLCIFDALECPSSNPMHDARQQVHGALVASVKELAGNRDLGALFDEIARSLAVPEKAEPGRPRDDPRPGPQQPFD